MIIPLLEQRNKRVEYMKNNSSVKDGEGSASPNRFQDDIRPQDGNPQISQISEISSSKEVSNSLYSIPKPIVFGFQHLAGDKNYSNRDRSASDDVQF